MGTCIPPEILGHSGYLQQKQQLIDSMRLFTSGSCSENRNGQCGIILSSFPRLRKLLWSGLRSRNDIETLKDTLRQISDQIVEFELDFIDWDDVKSEFSLDTEDSDAFLVGNILELPSKSTKRMFPALQVLSLSSVSFRSGTKELAHAFDFSSLSSLKLYLCSGWEYFLRHGSDLSRPSRLKVLEIKTTIDQEVEPVDSISNFLESFRGLEHLAISTSSPTRMLEIWRAACHHRASLKAFAHHQQSINPDEPSPGGYDDPDLPDLSRSVFEEKMTEWTENPSQHPLGELNLEFLGLYCDPKLLVWVPYTSLLYYCLTIS